MTGKTPGYWPPPAVPPRQGGFQARYLQDEDLQATISMDDQLPRLLAPTGPSYRYQESRRERSPIWPIWWLITFMIALMLVQDVIRWRVFCDMPLIDAVTASVLIGEPTDQMCMGYRLYGDVNGEPTT